MEQHATEVKQENRTVKLPPRRIAKYNRLTGADAYTAGGNVFQSIKAKEKSTYYVMFRRALFDINPDLYTKGDDRIVFYGLGRKLEQLFYDPITHEEIDLALKFYENAKVTSKGLARYNFPEKVWRTVVDKYNGRPPIKIEAMLEGSVVYPNEPVMQISSTSIKEEEMGELAAWFESKLLHIYATCERATQDRHWLTWLTRTIYSIDSENPQLELDASSMMTDFGDRAGMCIQESEEIPMAGLLSFMGTDTFSAAYQAWYESGMNEPTGISVLALAHRNVQAYEFEGDCYRAIYDAAKDNEILSMVADCFNYKKAVENYLLPLAIESKDTGNGKIVVARPDSGDALEQVLWTVRLAVKNGLYTERELVAADGTRKKYKFGTYLKFIEGDGMTFPMMKKIIQALIDEGFAPHGWGLFGVGGGLRNNLRRDNLSAKWALNAVGFENHGVIKSSEVAEKSSLPGPLKVRREKEYLDSGKTIAFLDEPGENMLVPYYDGSNKWEPFGPAMRQVFTKAKALLNEQWNTMPSNLGNWFPISDKVLEERNALLKKYSPDNYETRKF
jgi:nicotinic acid phosphoribosyltransferase